MVSAVPNWLRGLWKRLSIETADGQRDTQTQVFYLQASSCFGDLRLPIDRPDLGQANFSSLTRDDVLALSRQQGFAGIAQFEQGQCQWVRYIDYQPPQAARDIGLLYWQDDILIEEGVDQVYREEWRKVDDGDEDYTALVLAVEENTPRQALSWQASLVIAGDYFICSQNRPVTLPTAPTLADCLVSPTALNQQGYLACEISFGLCRSGRVPWEIQRSTIPWREGSSLWMPSELVIDLENQQVLQTVQQDNAPMIRSWKIQEWGTGKAFKV